MPCFPAHYFWRFGLVWSYFMIRLPFAHTTATEQIVHNGWETRARRGDRFPFFCCNDWKPFVHPGKAHECLLLVKVVHRAFFFFFFLFVQESPGNCYTHTDTQPRCCNSLLFEGTGCEKMNFINAFMAVQ